MALQKRLKKKKEEATRSPEETGVFNLGEFHGWFKKCF